MAEKSLIFCSFAVRSITYAAMLPVAQLDEPKWGMSQLAKKLRLTISC
ncbi:secreted protein [gut metagenome]|uniref:Secreted protein n=1 Tax=gut metagenome TaxID=749906 RepID=J9G1U2_9ZZZZ